MTIKEFAHSAQQRIALGIGITIKRTHIYELVAASFGYRSYAALCSEGVFTRRKSAAVLELHRLTVRQRCVALGYVSAADAISSTLSDILIEFHVGVTTIAKLVKSLSSVPFASIDAFGWDTDAVQDDPPNDFLGNVQTNNAASRLPKLGREQLIASAHNGDALAVNALKLLHRHEAGDPPAILLASLHSAATSGNALAHYALALIHKPHVGTNRTREEFVKARLPPFGGFKTALGRAIDQQWTREVAQERIRLDHYLTHLREAARLGHTQAQLEMADQLGDTQYFDNANRNAASSDVLALAEIAQRLGRDAEANSILTMAAESGDLDAMRYLVDVHDRHNPLRCRTWLYLAELLGSDLAPSDKYLLHRLRAPSSFDDSHPIEQHEENHDAQGVEVPQLDADSDRDAQTLARELFARIEHNRQTTVPIAQG